MFTKHVSELTYNDIEDLIVTQDAQEGHHLDFKAEFHNLDKAKLELAKDISAFANGNGGYLILGITDDKKITGVDSILQGRPIEEWINQVVSSNIEPLLYYQDPKVIDIPGSDKVIVVVHIPESLIKPHILIQKGTYHVRANDSCKLANHYQVRDMFEFSRNRANEFEAFLNKRNLLDEDSNDFASNKNSKRLYSDIPEKLKLPKPIVLFSLVPKIPNEEKVSLTIAELKMWLSKHSRGYYPSPNTDIFFASHYEQSLMDGILLQYKQSKMLTSYFEVLNSGYIECGISNSATYVYPNQQTKIPEAALYLAMIVGYEMLLLGFASKYYDFINYHDEVFLQVSIANVKNFVLEGLSEKYRSSFRFEASRNELYDNFKLTARFNPKTITDEDILEIGKSHSEKICRVFGLDKDYCFNDANEINHSIFNRFEL